MALKVTTGPTKEPVSVADAKAHARVEVDDDDGLLEGLIVSARQFVENHIGRSLINQTLTLYLDGFPSQGGSIALERPPISSITSVKYVDSAGVQQTLDSSKYSLDAVSEPARLLPAYGESWPVTRSHINVVEVAYVAGYGADKDSVPRAIRVAILQVVAHHYEHREVTISGTIITPIPMAAKETLTPYRLWGRRR